MREQTLINKVAVNVEVHTQLIIDLNNSQRGKSIIDHPLINLTLLISVMNATVESQMHASDVDRRIISLQTV